MVAESTKSIGQRRHRAVDMAYRKSLKSIHDDYNKTFDAMLRKHNLQINNIQDILSFPPEFHYDMAEAKKAFLSGHKLAQEAHHSSAANLPRKM